MVSCTLTVGANPTGFAGFVGLAASALGVLGSGAFSLPALLAIGASAVIPYFFLNSSSQAALS